jgi:hypothetical protein
MRSCAAHDGPRVKPGVTDVCQFAVFYSELATLINLSSYRL